MAAGVIPIVAGVISAIGPQIPGIVQFVEGLFGHSSTTGTKDGPTKLQTAVGLLTTALQALANAGKIPSAGVVDPSLPAGLAGAVQQVVDLLQGQGLLGPGIPPGPQLVPLAPSAPGTVSAPQSIKIGPGQILLVTA